MKFSLAVLLVFLLASCRDLPSGPNDQSSLIVANVHWQNQGIPGIQIVLVQTADTALTGSNGMAMFSVPPGHYTVRAFGINRGGPILLNGVDYEVAAPAGNSVVVDIVDCLPCL